MSYFGGEYDVIVIGAGHAGIEAALAAARLGASVAVFVMNMDSVGNLPCNPSIGGTAKGHLVREIDALGGEMARAADANTLQSRMLNRGKGPAVHSLRAQIDRRAYGAYMKKTLERQERLELRQGEAVDLYREGEVWAVETRLGGKYLAKAVIIATGTFLGGKIYVGETSYDGGPDGMFPATRLSAAIKKLGLPLRRFKTGTPARVNRRSIDFTDLEPQYGDEPITPFSFMTDPDSLKNTEICHITWTNADTKRVILDNLDRSPMYSGKIDGVGPRYCPSIEDKIVRFSDRDRHQIFIEPCGAATEEMYLQGVSTSLPEEVQQQLYRTVKGLENVQIMRSAYAIEYDCVDPTALLPTLEVKGQSGLYGAGQFNGSSGYEEAAAQGLVAGINAYLKIAGRDPLILPRSGSYIGTLIDDLVSKGCSDPYRMMTSRSEYRLVLRQDNAMERLTEIGREIGLVSDEYWQMYEARQEKKRRELERIKKTVLPPSDEVNRVLTQAGTSPIVTGVRLWELLRRPQLSYAALREVDPTRPDDLDAPLTEHIETEVKYEGYIAKQQASIAEQRRLEGRALPPDIDYDSIAGLRLEAREKLQKIRPLNIGQASVISGVSPADISVLLIYLAKEGSGK